MDSDSHGDEYIIDPCESRKEARVWMKRYNPINKLKLVRFTRETKKV